MAAAPEVIAASDLVDRLDWVTPAEVLDHLAIPLEGFSERPVTAVDTTTGRTLAVCATYIEVDVLDHLAAGHGTEPSVGCVAPRPCQPDHNPDQLVHFRTRLLFGDRPHPPKEQHQ